MNWEIILSAGVPVVTGIILLSVKLGKIDTSIKFLQGAVDALGVRMGLLETRMNDLDTRMNDLDTRMNGLESKMTRLEKRQDRFEKTLSKLSIAVGNIKVRLKRMEQK